MTNSRASSRLSTRRDTRRTDLSCWKAQTEPVVTVDRIIRGTVYTPYVTLSLIGGIQPDTLAGYLADAVHGGKGNDRAWLNVFNCSFIQMPCGTTNMSTGHPMNKRWRRSKRSSVGCHVWTESIRACTASRRRPSRCSLRSSRKMSAGEERGELPSVLETHFGKYGQLMPKLALIFQLVEDPDGNEVGFIQAQRAAAMCDYLESHAKRVYASVAASQDRGTAELAGLIKKRALGQLLPPSRCVQPRTLHR